LKSAQRGCYECEKAGLHRGGEEGRKKNGLLRKVF
jgi:hypothetical protein